MTVNLIKLCVGIEDVERLEDVQARRLREAVERGEPPELMHVTKSFPRRASEILDGGSIYWVIKGYIRVRQPIVDLRETLRDEDKKYCAIILDSGLVRTELRQFRPFQGWRYLDVEAAPRDARGGADAADLPNQLADELRGLGLL